MINELDNVINESEDKLHHECGVVGVYLGSSKKNESGKDSDVSAASSAYFGLYSLQHRGQESAGIVVSDGKNVKVHKANGLLADVFQKEDILKLKGNIAVGHVRYATAEQKGLENAQPMMCKCKLGNLAISYNGQLVNYKQLREMLEENGSTFTSTSDTEVILKLIAKSYKKGLERALTDSIQMIKGSFALCVMTEKSLIGARDPNGMSPLCLGKLDNGWVLASESCAIDSMNGTFIRDIRPGEIIIINDDGVLSFEFGEKTSKHTCVFEYVYFARPDSIIDGIAVQDARVKMGAQLAKEFPVDADVVIGVPDSGLGSAIGYSKASGIPYAMGIVKNKYIGRTFIAPTQKERENLVFVKLNALKSDVEGKRVVVIDDSIVRGTTSRRLIQIIRRAGAKEVHFRVSSPRVKHPCHFGIDTPSKEELIASVHDVEHIRKEIGADTLAFISLDGMLNALKTCNPEQYGFCSGCFTGEYPMAIPEED